jgi:hypothetical protein
MPIRNEAMFGLESERKAQLTLLIFVSRRDIQIVARQFIAGLGEPQRTISLSPRGTAEFFRNVGLILP